MTADQLHYLWGGSFTQPILYCCIRSNWSKIQESEVQHKNFKVSHTISPTIMYLQYFPWSLNHIFWSQVSPIYFSLLKWLVLKIWQRTIDTWTNRNKLSFILAFISKEKIVYIWRWAKQHMEIIFNIIVFLVFSSSLSYEWFHSK